MSQMYTLPISVLSFCKRFSLIHFVVDLNPLVVRSMVSDEGVTDTFDVTLHNFELRLKYFDYRDCSTESKYSAWHAEISAWKPVIG